MDIKNAIQKRGMLMSKAAEMMGITPQALSQIVNGNPTVKKIEMLAKAIGCSPAEFFADWDTAPENKHQKVSTDETLLEAPQEQMPQQAAEDLPLNNDEEKPTAQGIFICPHCGKGVTIEVKG